MKLKIKGADVRKIVFSALLLLLVISAKAQLSDAQAQRFTEYTNHSEDVFFWRNVFASGTTNFSETEFVNHLSHDGRQEITSHMTYDEHISIALLNALVDQTLSYGTQCDDSFGKLPQTERTPEITKFISAYHYWQIVFFQNVAHRPEIDRPLAEKLLAQVKPPNFFVGLTLARNPSTPQDILEVLSKEPFNLNFDVACNPNVSTNLLWHLLAAGKAVQRVQINLGSRNSTDAGFLSQLATNADRDVRTAVGRNTNAPTKILLVLTNDTDVQVKLAALHGLAMSPKTPIDILQDLARYPRDTIQVCVARNPATPRPLLEQLLNEDTSTVWEAAFRVLAAQKDAPRELLEKRLRAAAAVEKRVLSGEKGLPDWVYKEL